LIGILNPGVTYAIKHNRNRKQPKKGTSKEFRGQEEWKQENLKKTLTKTDTKARTIKSNTLGARQGKRVKRGRPKGVKTQNG